MTTAQDRLNQILPSWYDLLTQWTLDGSLVAAATDALMLDSSNAKQDAKGQLQSYVSQWSAGNFHNLPKIVLLSAADISGAYGAYADSTDTIYLNQDWLLTASDEEIQKVLTEELGHYLDDQLNQEDTYGDEGEIFSQLLVDEYPKSQSIDSFTTQQDRIVLQVGDGPIEAEAFTAFIVNEDTNSSQLAFNISATVEYLDASAGVWQYRSSGGSDWLTINSELINSTTTNLAVHFNSGDQIRINPYPNSHGSFSDSIIVRQYFGAYVASGVYNYATPGQNGYSSETFAGGIIVNSINDVPSFYRSDITGISSTSARPSSDVAYDCKRQADGKIILAGWSRELNDGSTDDCDAVTVMRLNADGSVDKTFGTGGFITTAYGGNFYAFSLDLQQDGKIVIGGSNGNHALMRLNVDGSFDEQFGGDSSFPGRITINNGSIAFGSSTVVQPDGKILLSAYTTLSYTTSLSTRDYEYSIVRVNADGSLDTSFGDSGRSLLSYSRYNDQPFELTLQSDGKILATGFTTDEQGRTHILVSRQNTNGSLDTSFGNNGFSTPLSGTSLISSRSNAIEILKDGSIIVAGMADNRFVVAKMLSNGILDSSFGVNGITYIQNDLTIGSVESLAVTADNKIYAIGNSVVVKLLENGELDSSFANNGFLNLSSTLYATSAVLAEFGGLILTGAYGNDFGAVKIFADGRIDKTFGSAPISELPSTTLYQNTGFQIVKTEFQIIDRDLDIQNDYAGSTLKFNISLPESTSPVFSFNEPYAIQGSSLFSGDTLIGQLSIQSVGISIEFADGATRESINTLLTNIVINTNIMPPGAYDVQWIFEDGNKGIQGPAGVETAMQVSQLSILESSVGVVSAIFSQDTVSIAGEGETVVLLITFADTPSGYSTAGVHFYSPLDHARQFYSTVPIVGNQATVSISLDQWAANGDWRIAEINSYDNDGRFSVEYEDQLVSKGIDTRLSVANTAGDNILPVLTSLTGYQEQLGANVFGDIVIRIGFSDENSGLSCIGLQIAPEGSDNKYFGDIYSSDIADGIATFRLTNEILASYGISMDSMQPAGNWNILEVNSYDNAGNFRVYYRDELASAGFQTDFQFTSNPQSFLQISSPGSGLLNGISFSNVFDIDLTSFDDSIDILESAGNNIPMTIDGGDGSDTLNGNSLKNKLVLTGINQGTLDGIQFSGIENINLGSGNDEVYIMSGGMLTGLLNGGSGGTVTYVPPGDDIGDYDGGGGGGDGYVDSGGNPVTTDPGPTTPDPIEFKPVPPGFKFNGGLNSIFMNDEINTASINGPGYGVVDGTDFLNFYALDLKGGDDIATINPLGYLFGKLSGGEGNDTLNLSANNNVLAINQGLIGDVDRTDFDSFEIVNLLAGDDSVFVNINALPPSSPDPRKSLTLNGGDGTDQLTLKITREEVRYLESQGTFDDLQAYLASPTGTTITIALSSIDLTLTGFEDTGFFNSSPNQIAITSTQLDENLAVGSVVASLSAFDPDQAEGLSFYFANQNGESSLELGIFVLDGSNVRLAAVPDFEFNSSYDLTLRVVDDFGAYYDKEIVIAVRDINEAPTDLTFTSFGIAENSAAGAVIGILSADDPDAGSYFTYALALGAGDTDNNLVEIINDKVYVKSGAVIDFESNSTLDLRIQVTDNGTPALSFTKAVTVSVLNVNEAPTIINLSATSFDENIAAASTVATLSNIDLDLNDTATYSLVSGTGSTDNGAFTINGTQLKINSSPDFETKNSYNIRIRTTDAGGLFFDKTFTLTVNNIPESTRYFGTGNSTINGTAGDDLYTGTNSNNIFNAGAGYDRADRSGDSKNYTVSGTSGTGGTALIESITTVKTGKTTSTSVALLDTLNQVESIQILGGTSANTINAGGGTTNGITRSAFNGTFIASGGAGIDTITGGSFKNWLAGNGFATGVTSGIETLNGTTNTANGAMDVFDLRKDTLTGVAYLGGGSSDYARITNFNAGTDKLVLTGSASNYTFAYTQVVNQKTKAVTDAYWSVSSGGDLIAQIRGSLTNFNSGTSVLYGTGDHTTFGLGF